MLELWSQSAWVLVQALSLMSYETLDKLFSPFLDDDSSTYHIGLL